MRKEIDSLSSLKKPNQVGHSKIATEISQDLGSTLKNDILRKLLESGFEEVKQYALDLLALGLGNDLDDLDKKLIIEIILNKIIKEKLGTLNRREIYHLAEVLKDIDGFEFNTDTWTNYLDLHRPVSEMTVNESKIKRYLDEVTIIFFGYNYNLNFN